VIVGESTSNAGYLDPKYSPLPIADPQGGVPNTRLLTESDRFDKRMVMANKLGQQFVDKDKYAGPKSYVEYYDQATKLLKSSDLAAFDLTGETNREAYGMNRVGQGCLPGPPVGRKRRSRSLRSLTMAGTCTSGRNKE